MYDLGLTIIVLSKDNPLQVELTFQSISSCFHDSNYVCNLIHLDASQSAPTHQHSRLLPSNIRYSFVKQYGTGIFRGMNQALLAANTRFVWFLNSGDQIVKNLSLERFASFLLHAPLSVKFIIFQTIVASTPPRLRYTTANRFALLAPLSPLFPCHQSCIFDLCLHKQILYPETYGADEYVIRNFILRSLFSSSFLSCQLYPLSLYDITGISSSLAITPSQFLRRIASYLRLALFHRILSDIPRLIRFYLH